MTRAVEMREEIKGPTEADLRDDYLADRITLEEFEQRIGNARQVPPEREDQLAATYPILLMAYMVVVVIVLNTLLSLVG